jgi:hypothetical protein
MLLESQFEQSILNLNEMATAWKSVFESHRERFVGPNFENCLKRRSQIATVVMENRRERADLRRPCRRFRIGREMIIKSPATNGFPNGQPSGLKLLTPVLQH